MDSITTTTIAVIRTPYQSVVKDSILIINSNMEEPYRFREIMVKSSV